MSTTDTRCTDFEAWAIKENYAFYSESERRVLFYGVSGTRNAIQKAWEAGMARAATEAAKTEPTEFKGWYCAHCQRGVDASEVTFHEQHTVCGRVITDDCPPAAKATGTAGELPELPEPTASSPHGAHLYSLDKMLSYARAAIHKQWCAEVNCDAVREELAELKTSLCHKDAGKCGAGGYCPECPARQPPPVVAVKTWEDRANENGAFPIFSGDQITPYMKAEIAELRAALAARSQP